MTIAAVANAKSYDWSTWLMGIMRSFVSGGAGAIAAAVGTMGLDPAKFNLVNLDGITHVFAMMGIMFILQGVVHLAIFLQTHGSPEEVAVQKEIATAVKNGRAVVVSSYPASAEGEPVPVTPIAVAGPPPQSQSATAGSGPNHG